ncbi:MAG: DUF1681 domain-containing protein, partial [Planctomycetota bacterium]
RGELFAECPLPNDAPVSTAVEPVIDSSRYFVLRVVDDASGRHAFLGLGFQDQRLAGVLPLPIDLGTLGAPGCQIHVDLVALGAAATDGLGFARQSLTLPVQGGLVGQTFYAQWLVLSPAANTLGLVTSAGAACRIGN